MNDLQISVRETAAIIESLQTALALAGDVVEFGCYQGDTSVQLATAMQSSQDKWLWLYDSFEGLPEKTAADHTAAGWRFKAGELKASPEMVLHKFRKYRLPDPVIKRGWFNQLDPNSDLPDQICFALLDGDFYESIKTSLALVAPKLTVGGVIAVHDYRNPELPGSAKAVNEFMAEQGSHYAMSLRAGVVFLTREA